jgi:hypothetical protein
MTLHNCQLILNTMIGNWIWRVHNSRHPFLFQFSSFYDCHGLQYKTRSSVLKSNAYCSWNMNSFINLDFTAEWPVFIYVQDVSDCAISDEHKHRLIPYEGSTHWLSRINGNARNGIQTFPKRSSTRWNTGGGGGGGRVAPARGKDQLRALVTTVILPSGSIKGGGFLGWLSQQAAWC